jgi:hypothetical protein
MPLTLSAKEVVAQGKAAGIKLDDTYVHKIRRTAKRKGAGPKPAAKKVSAAPNKSSKPANPPSATMSKADFVRERGHLSPKEIVEDAKTHGVKLDANYVYTVRGYDKRASKKRRATKKAASENPAATAPTATASISKPSTNGTHRADTKVEDLLRAAAAELGLGRAIEILQSERARVRAVIGG